MASGELVGIVAGTASGEVLLFTAALAWQGRRFISKVDALVHEVTDLARQLAIQNVTGPDLVRRVEDLEDESIEQGRVAAVLRSRMDEHRDWHAHGMPSPGRPVPG